MKSQQLTYKQKTIISQGYKHHSRIVEPIFRVFFSFTKLNMSWKRVITEYSLSPRRKWQQIFLRKQMLSLRIAVGKSLNKTFEYLSKFNLK